MDYTHIGWIPCINGHLDYGLMKPSIKGGFTNLNYVDEKTTCVSYSYNHRNNAHHARRFMMQSKVDWRDTADDDYDGNFRVFLIASANQSSSLDERSLEGSIFIYRSAHEPKLRNERQKLEYFEIIHSAKKELEEYNDSMGHDWDRYSKGLDEKYFRLEKSLQSIQSCFLVNFKVLPSGLSYLTLASNKVELDHDSKYALIRQAFYYLKYSLHEHKHHDNQTDSLTTVVSLEDIKSEFKEVAQQNSAIALKLLGQLKRELTSIKRSYSDGETAQVTDAQGVIAYMKSLLETMYSLGFLGKEKYLREANYLVSLSSSFDAQTNKIQRNEQKTDQIKSRNRVVFGWLISIVSLLFLIFSRFYLRSGAEDEKHAFNYGWGELSVCVLFIGVVVAVVYKKITDAEISMHKDNLVFAQWLQKKYLGVSATQFFSTSFEAAVFYTLVSCHLLYIAFVVDYMSKTLPIFFQ